MEGTPLPPEILVQQICHICKQYLSVGPVRISSTGQIVCGRLDCHSFIKGESKESLYNIVAAVCLFNCISHYTGCKMVFAFNKAVDHEIICVSEAKLYECPFCFYQGKVWQLICHFRKVHPAYSSEEITLEKILSYEGLNGHIESTLKLSDLELKKRFLNDAPKVVLPTCGNCKSKISQLENIYFHTKHQVVCQDCCVKKCDPDLWQIGASTLTQTQQPYFYTRI